MYVHLNNLHIIYFASKYKADIGNSRFFKSYFSLQTFMNFHKFSYCNFLSIPFNVNKISKVSNKDIPLYYSIININMFELKVNILPFHIEVK